jgi:hypothetical protein
MFYLDDLLKYFLGDSVHHLTTAFPVFGVRSDHLLDSANSSDVYHSKFNKDVICHASKSGMLCIKNDPKHHTIASWNTFCQTKEGASQESTATGSDATHLCKDSSAPTVAKDNITGHLSLYSNMKGALTKRLGMTSTPGTQKLLCQVGHNKVSLFLKNSGKAHVINRIKIVDKANNKTFKLENGNFRLKHLNGSKLQVPSSNLSKLQSKLGQDPITSKNADQVCKNVFKDIEKSPFGWFLSDSVKTASFL